MVAELDSATSDFEGGIERRRLFVVLENALPSRLAASSGHERQPFFGRGRVHRLLIHRRRREVGALVAPVGRPTLVRQAPAPCRPESPSDD